MDAENQVFGASDWDPADSWGIFDLEELNELQILKRVIEEKDVFTWSHSINVANYSYTLADIFSFSNEQKFNIYIGALLHDVGKVEIPEVILKKAGKLTPDEWEVMKTHPKVGYNLLKGFGRLMKRGIPDIVLHHHERYDGKGYPDGLAGDEISIASRIVTVADCFDAMTSNRVYRNAKDKSTAAKEILSNAYAQFDPQISRVFVDFIMSGSPLRPPPYSLQHPVLFQKQKSS